MKHKIKSQMTQKEDFEKYLYYCPNSKSKLRWKISPSSKIKKDSEAGFLNFTNGEFRWRVGINGLNYYVSRIIYILHHDTISMACQIDHIDGDPLNNFIDNLRVVSPRHNAQNKKILSNNSSGKCGVSLSCRKDGWKANYVNMDGKLKTKTFNFKKYGSKDEAFELASNWREEKIKEMNNLYEQQYTERHGV